MYIYIYIIHIYNEGNFYIYEIDANHSILSRLLLLSDGRTAYMGVASDAVTFFKR